MTSPLHTTVSPPALTTLPVLVEKAWWIEDDKCQFPASKLTVLRPVFCRPKLVSLNLQRFVNNWQQKYEECLIMFLSGAIKKVARNVENHISDLSLCL